MNSDNCELNTNNRIKATSIIFTNPTKSDKATSAINRFLEVIDRVYYLLNQIKNSESLEQDQKINPSRNITAIRNIINDCIV